MVYIDSYLRTYKQTAEHIHTNKCNSYQSHINFNIESKPILVFKCKQTDTSLKFLLSDNYV